jgi:hypothetical protein
VQKVSQKVEDTQISDVDAKIGFPTFQKFSETFGVDLTEKTTKLERESLYLSIDEVHKLYVESECKMLEDYVTELGENGHEF